MKNSSLCLQCVFIFALSRFLVLAEDASAEDAPSDDDVPELDSAAGETVPLEPSADVSGFSDKVVENGDVFQQMFAEATSQNSGVANDITTSGPPVVVTLSDAATAELQQRAILPSQNAEAVETGHLNQTNQTDVDFKEINQTRPEQPDKLDVLKENLTEEIPSFSEWAQKQLEEAEKNKTNASTQHPNANGKQKLRWKNYASLDCGAKVVASNPEAVSPSAILSPSRDEYKLNTCTSRIWFVVELCEAIQAKKIDLANFELFSSSPKDFVVSVSDRFPSRDWSNVGQFTAKDERDIQSFDLSPHLFGKYIKVEVKSHYGSEHYCPISLFRVYGTSEFEVLQKEDPVHADRMEEDDDDDDESLDSDNDASKNLFSSATDAVISIVKKAAEVLGNKGNHSNQTEPSNHTKQVVPLIKVCTSPSHLVVCVNCSDTLFGQIYELLSCHDSEIATLAHSPLIRKALTQTLICAPFGFNFSKPGPSRPSYIAALFPDRYIGAMCNMAAIFQSKVVLNVSNHYTNATQVTDDKLVNIETSELNVVAVEPARDEVTDALNLDLTEAVKSTCSTDVTYAGQIKPTKTLTPDLDLGGHTEVVEADGQPTNPEPPKVNTSEKIEVVETEDKVEVETVTESVELDEQLEHFMEFNGDSQHVQTTASTTPQAQKESVFLRLSNRIKALERNMSLSGQYLEELSKRYKKQVEEIQKLLDKTIASISEESKKKDERNKQLEERLAALTASVDALIAEKKSWSSTVYCVIVSSLVTLFLVTFCAKIPDPIAPKRPEMKRRKSIDVVHQPPHKKKRRPSDQALKIVRSSMEASESLKKKKRKQQALKRSNSISTLTEEKTAAVWTRQESAPAAVCVDWVEGKHLEEVPFVLEESEHSSLEPLALAEGGKITAPNFVKTALSSRAVRVNGDAFKAARKSASVDETSRRKVSANGSVGGEGGTPKEKRRGLRRIFRKVF
ncbi:SUN domain-containing ossification factor-like isoform X1 [Zophobas morio]|uniref:SUN domain-containing ossification factor-like isoform X1 n=1 Tax=Zophobas morio TaxID=2755281 RepID=UPI0030839630